MSRLLIGYPASSEDFFKLWPHDKMYFLNERTIAVGIKSTRELPVVGDPAGDPQTFDVLLTLFLNCAIHTIGRQHLSIPSQSISLYIINTVSIFKNRRRSSG